MHWNTYQNTSYYNLYNFHDIIHNMFLYIPSDSLLPLSR